MSLFFLFSCFSNSVNSATVPPSKGV
jgi:hypothetical protein